MYGGNVGLIILVQQSLLLQACYII